MTSILNCIGWIVIFFKDPEDVHPVYYLLPFNPIVFLIIAVYLDVDYKNMKNEIDSLVGLQYNFKKL